MRKVHAACVTHESVEVTSKRTWLMGVVSGSNGLVAGCANQASRGTNRRGSLLRRCTAQSKGKVDYIEGAAGNRRLIELTCCHILAPAWPVRHQLVELLAGTLGGTKLPMSVDVIVGMQLVQAYSLLHQPACCPQLPLLGRNMDEGAYEGNAHRDSTISLHMLTLCMPATSHIDLTIAANEEVIADVRKAKGFHVKVLYHAHAIDALILQRIHVCD